MAELAPRTTLGALLASARARLAKAGLEEAALEARLIVEHCTGTDRREAIADPCKAIAEADAAAVDEALSRRLAGAPVFRILGRRDFHGLTLALSPETLDPRPDTEALVDLVLPRLREMAARLGACRILDLGTGTGAIALALLKEIPVAVAVGSDIQRGALETARRNAEMNGLSARFETCHSDWFSAIDGRFHAIVANPPYIRTSELSGLTREVREHDPLLALDGGPDGLVAYRRIAADAARYLEPGGFVAVEIGHDQIRDVEALFGAAGLAFSGMSKDLGGRDRAAMFSPEKAVEQMQQKGLGNTGECR
jgi:release factor glutamine methyltransferase